MLQDKAWAAFDLDQSVGCGSGTIVGNLRKAQTCTMRIHNAEVATALADLFEIEGQSVWMRADRRAARTIEDLAEAALG
jgi:hypothetical protein